MRRNTVKERLARGEATLGCFLGLGSPTLAELFAQAGFDWLVIETEHNALDTAEIQTMLMAINGTDAVPLVRVPKLDHVAIQRALDVGAMGVVVPLVRSAAEVEAVVRATRYPPVGRRSFGPLRASRYGLDNASYLAEADDNMLVVVILETLEAVAELDEIARVDGLDGIWLGLFDLCLAMGLDPLQLPHPEIDEVIARTSPRVARRTWRSGRTPSEADAARTARRGLPDGRVRSRLPAADGDCWPTACRPSPPPAGRSS